jgi:CdvA-like coiled-coil domain
MSQNSNSNLFLSIGKPLKDEYGRAVGKIASFALTPSGKFDAVFIEFSDGTFLKQPMEQLKFNGAEVTFISKNKSQASILCDQIPLIWRKDQALKDLAEKRKISPDLYQEIHNNFEGVLNQLKKDAQVLSDEINKEIARCDEEIRTLNYAVVHLELEHEIGKIGDEAYRSVFALLQENLKRANTEKTDIELAKNKLANILLGDSSHSEQKPKVLAEPINEAPELPEPPVVVYVKEIGKAGI